MRKVILWNKTEFFIPNDKEAPLLEAMELAKVEEIGFYLNHAGGRAWIGSPKAVALITDGGFDAPVLIDHNKRLPMPELTDEQRAANIEKLSKMRHDWLIAREKKKADKIAEKERLRKIESDKENAARLKAQDDLHKFIEKQRKEGRIKPNEK